MEKDEIIKIRDELREKLEEGSKNVKIGKITYYEEFQLFQQQGFKFAPKDVFVVSKKISQKGLELEVLSLYSKSGNLIGTTNQNGELILDEKYKEALKDFGIDIDKQKVYIDKEREYVATDKPVKQMTKEEQDKLQEKEEEQKSKKVPLVEPAQLEEDMGIPKEDIGYCTKIKDKEFFKQIPESKNFNGDTCLIQDKKSGRYMIVGERDGKFYPYETIEPAYPTNESSIDLDDRGEDIKREQITAKMRVKGSYEEYFSISHDAEESRLEFQFLRRDLTTGELISSDVETDRQYPASEEIREIMDKYKNPDIQDEVEKFREEEELQEKNPKREIDARDISDDEEDYGKVPWENPRSRYWEREVCVWKI